MLCSSQRPVCVLFQLKFDHNFGLEDKLNQYYQCLTIKSRLVTWVLLGGSGGLVPRLGCGKMVVKHNP